MRSKVFPTLRLVPLGALWLVSACASNPVPMQLHPPVADLTVEAKPVLAPEAINSDAALIAHDIALEMWGERGWAQVARLCRWAVEMGAEGVTCPRPPVPPRPG